MTGLLAGLKALGPARLFAMAVVAVGLLAMLAVLAMRGSADRYALLYADIELREIGQMTEQLDKQHIAYQLVADGSRILVPSAEVARARMLLARDGLPSGGSVGYEIFDRGDGLAASSFQQSINQTRALEGELGRTIRGIAGVRAARVHLVLPRREPFARDRQDAQASVMLTMTGPGRLDRQGAQAIVTLVAAAVPGLRPNAVTIVDSRGDVLARAGEATGAIAATANAQELRRAAELRLSRAVEEMLERGFGVGHVRAEAAIELDFDHVQETREQFDPDGQVPRSTQTTTDTTRSTEATPTVSVQNNLPNADAGVPPAAGTQESKSEETTNYEIGKTVRTISREQAQTRRLSVAVMIDGAADVAAPGLPGTSTPGNGIAASRRPLTAEELARVTALVRSAIGFDDKRGDHVEVISMRFADADFPTTSLPGLFGLPLERADLVRLAETALLGLVAILALLLVVRPMITRLTLSVPALTDTATSPGALAVAGPGGSIAALSGSGGPRASPLSSSSGAAPLMIEEDRLISVANIEGQVRASLLRRTAELIDKHPEESLAILRGWIAQDTNA